MADNIYSPNQTLRTMPPLDADKIRAVTVSFARDIPDSVYEEILIHAK